MLRYLCVVNGVVLACALMASCGDDEGSADDDVRLPVDAAVTLDAPVAPPDAARPDAAGPDAGIPDAGAPDADPTMPPTLCATGLYSDCAAETLSPGVVVYEPRYALWSDGTEKNRFVLIPDGETIDTSDMDFWDYPVGTKAWKEFIVGGTRVETRLIMKIGPTQDDWYMISYMWNEAQTEAIAVPLGENDVFGTDHDIPTQNQCAKCHEPLPGKLAGFTAIQLSHGGAGATLASLIADGRLSNPPAAPFVVPDDGTGTAEPALGYLHGNCGNCHNDNSDVSTTVDARFWLTTAELGTVEATSIYTTTVGIVHSQALGPEVTALIEPGMPDASAVHVRMNDRGAVKMPPVGSEIADPTGLAAVDAWINQLGL